MVAGRGRHRHLGALIALLAGLACAGPAGRGRRPSAAPPARPPAGAWPPAAANVLATDLATSSSSEPRDVSLATRLVTTSRISVSLRIVSVCRDVSRFRRRSAPSWMALARTVASSSICLACALALESVFSASLVASLMARSVSRRAELRILSASARAVAIAFSACSCAAVSIRSVCSRASARIRSASFLASSRCLPISSWARLRWALASSSASFRIWPTRSLISSWAGLPLRPWRAAVSSRRTRSVSSSDCESRSSRSRAWLRERATNSSTWRRLYPRIWTSKVPSLSMSVIRSASSVIVAPRKSLAGG